MSFFGATIKCGDSLVLKSSDAELVHLSNLVLVGDVKSKDQFRVTVADVNAKEYVAAILTENHLQHACDLYLATGAKVSFLQSGGKGSKVELHLTGYSEPTDPVTEEGDESSEEESADEVGKSQAVEILKQMNKLYSDKEKASRSEQKEGKAAKGAEEWSEDEDSEASGQEESEGSQSQSDEEVEERITPAAAKSKAEAAIAKLRASNPDSSEGEEEEEVDEESDGREITEKASDSGSEEEEQEEAGSEEEDEEEEEEEEDVSEEEAPQPPPKPSKKQPRKEEPVEKKRKAVNPPENSPAPKKAAVGVDAYELAIIELIKTSGSPVKISHIGAKVKRPADFKGKLGQWIKDRPKVFKLNGDSVSLVKK